MGKLEKWVVFSITGMVGLAILLGVLIVNLLATTLVVKLITHLIKILH